MKIFDCFPFNNELDLLELRFAELYDAVDHFVLVEANTTFTSRPKPLYFQENMARFSRYLDKIIHVKVLDMPRDPNAWVNDVWQRNAINRGLDHAESMDIIMVSDVDEIPRAQTVNGMRTDEETMIWGLRMPLFNFKLNYMLTTADFYAIWGMATRGQYMIPADELRQQRFQLMSLSSDVSGSIKILEHAGWHFTYLGDTEFAREKIASFAHTETNVPDIVDRLDVERSIAQGDGIYHHPDYRFSPVVIDEYFPDPIRNLQVWDRYKLQGAKDLVWKWLPRR